MIISKSVVILGASGNLALTKLIPSIYTLFTSGVLPQNFALTGYARTEMSNEAFLALVEKNLRENVEETQLEANAVREFLRRINYVAGHYDSVDDFRRLNQELTRITANFPGQTQTLYYLSIPPEVFGPVIHSLKASGAVVKGKDSLQSVIVEKPFGYDTDTARELNATISETFDESQVYRIDHYLGKEAVQNLMVMRFANIIFEPVWNSKYIESVTISWEEDKAIGSRGGYFDKAGIIRDVMQNHLLQILALVAMEQPASLSSDAIAAEKSKVLKSIPPFELADVICGQYTDGVCAGKAVQGYLKEPGVPAGSKRETFALIKAALNTPRWKGVPFFIRAGKAMTKSSTEIIVQFKEIPNDIFTKSPHHPNKMVIKVQPDTGLVFHITNKVPGKGMILKDVKMDFSYNQSFTSMAMPGAYERLLLDAINNDKTLFISYDELIPSWEIFTPVLKLLDAGQGEIHNYAAGTKGPAKKF